MYSFVSAVGTGKSRNAQEFQNTCIEALKAYEPPFAECPGFQKRLQEARVFHIVLENGTSYTKLEGQNPDEILGARILLQVKGLDSLRAVYKKEIPPTIDILKAIARSDGKDFKEEWAAILLVDGLQHLLDRDVSELYSPYVVLRTETDETRVPVFNEESEIIKLLVSDCGGHGRPLETLYTVLVEAAGKNSAQMHYDILPLSLATSYIDRVVRRTTEIIQNRYCDAIRFNSLEQTAILRTSAWSDLNNQSSYEHTDSTTRKPTPPTTRISPQTLGEQLSQPLPPRLKLFNRFFQLASPPLIQNLHERALVQHSCDSTHTSGKTANRSTHTPGQQPLSNKITPTPDAARAPPPTAVQQCHQRMETASHGAHRPTKTQRTTTTMST
ncbi:hypothetical protein BGX38DRAFT_1267617 [Terfezia claveryi]|nr:hypothetical protein BGX38DRAFT_1267617 [Terfezia claveryi]